MKRQKQFEFNFDQQFSSTHQPLRMSPSFRIKFQSPTKVPKIKFIYQKDLKQYDSDYYDQFMGAFRTPTIHTQRAASQKLTQGQFRQQTPKNIYFNNKDSNQENERNKELLKIIREKKTHQNN